jgi:phosphoribosylformylglycinamidine (FGAM) synthase-like enzyme
MESHNHPSYIEPYQGAATGVGGILRDVFTMGARPIAAMNALRFGEPDHPKTRISSRAWSPASAATATASACRRSAARSTSTRLQRQHPGQRHCVASPRRQDLLLGRRRRRPAVVYLGAKTGRDGIHGATMASAEFDEEIEEKRPTVQVGDPFTEKLLLEACLELMATGAVIAIQDMGAAGLTCSSVEMAPRAGSASSSTSTRCRCARRA